MFLCALRRVQECRSLMTRSAPDASVGRMMHRVFHYLAEAIMLQLMSGKTGKAGSKRAAL